MAFHRGVLARGSSCPTAWSLEQHWTSAGDGWPTKEAGETHAEALLDRRGVVTLTRQSGPWRERMVSSQDGDKR